MLKSNKYSRSSRCFILAMISSLSVANEILDYGSLPSSVYYPGDNCCLVYDDTRLRGTVKKFCHTGKATVFEMNDYFIDNRMSSYHCGKNTWYNFCKNKGGDCIGQDMISGAG